MNRLLDIARQFGYMSDSGHTSSSGFFTTPPKPIDASIRRQDHHEADVVIVGAGVFGCAAAYALANQGRSVLLLERWLHEPDRIVGELLQPGGVASLRALGLGHCLEDIDAITCHGYTIFYHGDEALIRYPVIDGRGNVTDVWGMRANERRRDVELAKANGSWSSDGLRDGEKMTQGRAFHHGRFIMQLRRACESHPNITLKQADVSGVIRVDYTSEILGVTAQTTDAETGVKGPDYFFGRLTIAADGYDSRLRKILFPSLVPQVRSKFYSLELLDCQIPRPGHGHIFIGESITLLYQNGTRETRVLVDVPVNHPGASPAAGGVRGFIRNTMLPSLPPTVQQAVLAALDRDDRIPRSMPNSWMPAVPQTLLGVAVLGDAANMRHPLTGGGMTVAFNDALLLAEVLHPDRVPSLADVAAVSRAMTSLHWRRKSLTGNVNVLAQALYTFFAAANDPQMSVLQAGCFDYLKNGITEGPIGLLAGVIRRPMVLVLHFFAVTFYSIWLHIIAVVSSGRAGLGILKLPQALFDGVLLLWRAALIILPVLYREML